MMYEFIEPHDETPSPYNEFLGNNPDGGLHHLAYFCDDYDEALAQSRERGGEFDIIMELYMPDGSLMEIYVEPKNRPDGILTQLVVERLFGSFFKKAEAAAVDWDGKNPVRSIFDLLPSDFQPLVT